MGKRKRLNSVYMREATKSIIKTKKIEEINSYVTYKHILETTKRCEIYINGRKVALADKGYSILEYSPIDKLYNVRIFIDDNENILLYYFDVISNSEYIDGEIYYDDSYLDVLLFTDKATGNSSYIHLDDESELILALNNGEINKKDFDNAYRIAEEIMSELRDETNIFVNRKLIDFVEMK